MEPITIVVNDNTIEKMKKYYDSQMVPINDGHYLFKAEPIGCIIEADEDNNVTFSGQNALREAQHWCKSVETKTYHNISIDNIYPYHHIGSSETGSADYLGPICFVSCYVTEEDIPFLNSLNIKDTSTLTNQEIVDLAKQMKDCLSYSLLILDNSHYNKMVQDSLNLANIKARLFNQATVNVMQKVKHNVDVKVINQFVSSKTYFNYLKNEVIVVKDLMFETNAEKKYMAVLAADILSKYAYLQYYANMTKSLKINLCRGTGTTADIIAVKIATKYGEKILPKVAKLNFTNTKRVKAILEQKKES